MTSHQNTLFIKFMLRIKIYILRIFIKKKLLKKGNKIKSNCVLLKFEKCGSLKSLSLLIPVIQNYKNYRIHYTVYRSLVGFICIILLSR